MQMYQLLLHLPPQPEVVIDRYSMQGTFKQSVLGSCGYVPPLSSYGDDGLHFNVPKLATWDLSLEDTSC